MCVAFNCDKDKNRTIQIQSINFFFFLIQFLLNKSPSPISFHSFNTILSIFPLMHRCARAWMNERWKCSADSHQFKKDFYKSIRNLHIYANQNELTHAAQSVWIIKAFNMIMYSITFYRVGWLNMYLVYIYMRFVTSGTICLQFISYSKMIED